ncbi:DEAD/DEAH box helicase [Streptomyces cavernicola]|uniref:DEAD/DEAH box helicase n=1 Tax=Streptomyces cavernicola TaxID=3043613 RepID=A0ABT6S2P8_9ACTN|nr:DEAD/DEAH box helicase [Streptomyces sp. B-S-A6]MDI3402374.1 DEAD/DEAH box helicase [Streptomyces sp. B-S-A6]
MTDAAPSSPEAVLASPALDVDAGTLGEHASHQLTAHEGPPPAGTVVEVRDEEWLVRASREVRPGEFLIEAVGASDLVRGHAARFVTSLDSPRILRPEDTRLVADGSLAFRRSRLFLEAVLRKTPLPQIERRLALTDGFLLDRMDYQLRPAVKALANPLRPRLLIGDVVGLGKTLEIGVLLGELIRRGRGERILVVTPAPVLEQFQHEMWTRFSLPLVRLDSAGIARIERKIPAGRNPFTYYQRVIVSMDTLKNPKRYKPWLENIRWDAVVIDESHNLISRGSERRALADLLAERTDALILASATPHNGDMPSFTGLIRLLDPMAVKDPKQPKAEELRHLMLRRTKVSAEVEGALKGSWAPRGGSYSVPCAASDLEEQVFAELAAHWLAGSAADGAAPAAGGRNADDHLFPYVLLKSFLSSHRALFTTVRERLAKRGHKLPQEHNKVFHPPVEEPPSAAVPSEIASLLRLADLARAIESASREAAERPAKDRDLSATSKLAGLVTELRKIGVRPGSDIRAVVFSERRETLDWLGTVLPPLLGWKAGKPAEAAVKVLHSTVPDTVQMDYVDEFARAGSDVRVLLTGDGASEGVNLHRQCHHLIHWDLPWSLIRVEQRNGRIDRYGQTEPPEFRAMILTSQVEGALDDRAIAAKVLDREAKVHEVLGAVEAATKENDARQEEVRVMEALLRGVAPDDAVRDLETNPAAGDGDEPGELPIEQQTMSEFGTEPEADFPDFDVFDEFDAFAFADADADDGDDFGAFDTDGGMIGLHAETEAEAVTTPADGAEAAAVVPTVDELRLFNDRREYVLTGLDELADLESFRLDTEVDGTDLSFDTPDDLADRLDVLPSGYLRDQRIAQRMKLTFSKKDAADSLKRAREDADSTSLWPDAHYVGELHPVVEWITDKVLVQLGRQEAPVLQVVRGEKVPEPVVLTQGLWSNAEGRPTVVAWLAVDRLADGKQPRVRELTGELLAELGVGPGMDDHFAAGEIDDLQPLVPAAVAATRRQLDELRKIADREVDAPLREYEKRVGDWQQQTLPGFTGGRPARDAAAKTLTEAAQDLRTSGDEPMVRILAVLEPAE